MAKLYVMNCKTQDEVFSYRVPGTGQLINQTITRGGQIQVYRDETEDVLRMIAEQHRGYGMVEASMIDRTKPFINLAFQIDKPFTPDQIMYGLQHNTDVLEDRGIEQRTAAAVAISDLLDKAATTNGTVRAMELQIEDQTRNGEPTINERIAVDKNPNLQGSDRKGKNKRKGA